MSAYENICNKISEENIKWLKAYKRRHIFKPKFVQLITTIKDISTYYRRVEPKEEKDYDYTTKPSNLLSGILEKETDGYVVVNSRGSTYHIPWHQISRIYILDDEDTLLWSWECLL
jgi:hypothetical protein